MCFFSGFFGCRSATGLLKVSLQFVQAQTQIPSSSAAPVTLVDQVERGFLVQIYRLPEGISRDPRHRIQAVEDQLAGRLIDPETGELFPNEIETQGSSCEKTDDGGLVNDLDVAGAI